MMTGTWELSQPTVNPRLMIIRHLLGDVMPRYVNIVAWATPLMRMVITIFMIYRNPDETFKTNQFKVKLDGVIDTNWAQHYLNFDVTQTNKSRDRYCWMSNRMAYDVGNIYTRNHNDIPSNEDKY